MAPELIRKEDYDAKVDIFALGTLVFELCTNSIPFENYDETMIIDALQKNIGLDYEKLKDSPFRLIVEKCRAFSPKDRPCIEDVLSLLIDL